MDSEHSITHWIVQLKGGDEGAAQVIWDRFFHRVCALARKKMGSLPQRSLDEEDVALSAINALCLGAASDRFRQLENRDDLWQLLAMITSRKVANAWRKQTRSAEVGESVFAGGAEGESRGIDQIFSGSPNQDFVDSLSHTCEHLLSKLDDKLQTVAMLKLEGYTNEEIATQQNRSVKTIERYLKMIRQKWSSESA